ncbi:MAG: type II secretion system protein [Wolinella sp.]
MKRGSFAQRSAFTMIELVFIIALLGVLGAVAIPKMAASREDACLVRLKSELSAMRAHLNMESSEKFLRGESLGTLAIKDNTLFTVSQHCGWEVTPDGKVFTPYLNGRGGAAFSITMNGSVMSFDCDRSDRVCQKLLGI